MPKIDTDYTIHVTCPYCGTENMDSWEIVSQELEFDDEVVECGECGKDFYASRQCSITYSTRQR